MSDTVLISTFYSIEPFIPAMMAFSPKRIILIFDNDEVKVKQNIETIKKTFGSVAEIESEKVTRSDILGIAEKTVKIIEREKGKDNRIIVNVSGGWKLLANAVLYGCYARQELVDKIVCNRIDDNSMIELPKLSYGLTQPKKDILDAIANRDKRPIKEIATKLAKTRGMIYQHLKELKESGYVDEKFHITVAGKLALL